MKPRMFIGSSVEGKEIAEHIQLGLEYDVETTIWHQGIFGLSDGSLESLVKAAKEYDFAALVLTPDDLVMKRGSEKGSPRDNVVFELGLFMGALGRERTFIVYNRDKKPDLPTDLAGVTPATFANRTDGNLQAALGPVCTRIKQAIKACGVNAHHLVETVKPSADTAPPAETAKVASSPEPSQKENKEAVNHADQFLSGGGQQSVAQGSNAIGQQHNYYYAPPQQDAKPQPAPAAKAKPPTVVVDAMHRGDYATITDALKAVKAGTRILVRPGLYKEGIVIDKPVEIIGDGERSKIEIKTSGEPAVRFQADNGKLANLTLHQSTNRRCGVIDIVQGRLELENCDISTQGLACVLIRSSADPLLRSNRIHHGKRFGILVCEDGQGTLENNEIFANALVGVAIRKGGYLTLRRNRISQNGEIGIRVQSGGGGTFEDNDLRDNAKEALSIAPDCEANVQRSGNKE